jgi:hypothetical protein
MVDGGRAVGRGVAGWRAGADGPDAAHSGAETIPAAESTLVAAALDATLISDDATSQRPEGYRATGAIGASSGGHSNPGGQPADRA